MPAKNYRGKAERLLVTAAAARVAGQVVVEENIPGIAMVDAAAQAKYEIHVEGEFELAIPAGTPPAKGDAIYIHPTTFALTRVAARTAPTAASGVILFARVTGVPGNGVDANNAEPKSGKMYVKLVGLVHNDTPA